MKRLIIFTLSLITCFNILSQNVFIPDIEFKTRLLANTLINTNNDSEIQLTEANSYTGSIIEPRSGGDTITDLTGIEAFINLSGLDIRFHLVSSIDLTKNTQLTYVDLNRNDLTTIDLTKNNKLAHLNLNENDLDSIDLSKNVELTYLNVRANHLPELILSKNRKLIEIHADYNDFTRIDFSLHDSIEDISINFGKLVTIELPITGRRLVNLNLSFNDVTTLNNLANNFNLETLNLNYNDVTLLDLSMLTKLTFIGLNNTLLTDLNLQNGSNTLITSYYSRNTPSLSCILVDDVSYSNTNWTNIDAANNFALSCNTTYINKNNKNNIAVFPNPSSNNYISLKNTTAITRVEILDVFGKKIYSSNSLTNNIIDISNLSRGNYIINLIDNDIFHSEQFVKL